VSVDLHGCLLVHLALLTYFSHVHVQRTQFVWGGCMLLHKEALSPHHPSGLHQVSPYPCPGLAWSGQLAMLEAGRAPQPQQAVDITQRCGPTPQAWAQGGYSDDLILAALCTQRGYSIAVPSFAIFPQWLVGLGQLILLEMLFHLTLSLVTHHIACWLQA
jgi:hypothetical protein